MVENADINDRHPAFVMLYTMGVLTDIVMYRDVSHDGLFYTYLCTAKVDKAYLDAIQLYRNNPSFADMGIREYLSRMLGCDDTSNG